MISIETNITVENLPGGDPAFLSPIGAIRACYRLAILSRRLSR